MSARLNGLAPAEDCVDVEFQDFPEGGDVDESLVDCGRADFLPGSTPWFDPQGVSFGECSRLEWNILL